MVLAPALAASVPWKRKDRGRTAHAIGDHGSVGVFFFQARRDDRHLGVTAARASGAMTASGQELVPVDAARNTKRRVQCEYRRFLEKATCRRGSAKAQDGEQSRGRWEAGPRRAIKKKKNPPNNPPKEKKIKPKKKNTPPPKQPQKTPPPNPPNNPTQTPPKKTTPNKQKSPPTYQPKSSATKAKRHCVQISLCQAD